MQPGNPQTQPQEADYIREQHGCGPLAWLRDHGWLGADAVAAHLTYADEADLDAPRADARVPGRADIGRLAPGQKADLIMLDLDRLHLQPFYGDYPTLVFYVRASDVVAGLVDGRVVLEDGRPTGLDEADILREVKKLLPRWRERLRRHGSLAVVMPGACPGC